MSGDYILDTNILVAFFKSEDPIIKKMAKAKNIFVPSIVIGELYYGAYKSGRVDENISRIDNFRSKIPILDCTAETAKIYGKIKNKLKLNGTPIPENDIWIAAMAMQYDITLVTRDKHFDKVENLVAEKW